MTADSSWQQLAFITFQKESLAAPVTTIGRDKAALESIFWIRDPVMRHSRASVEMSAAGSEYGKSRSPKDRERCKMSEKLRARDIGSDSSANCFHLENKPNALTREAD